VSLHPVLRRGAPSEVGADRTVAFLEDFAVRGQASASTQNQALKSVVFVYKKVLVQALADLGDFTRANWPRRLPVVLTRGEDGACWNSSMACRI
jgi:hypothetical protein